MDSEEGYVPECTNTTWSIFSKKVLNHKLSFICINVRSLLGKFDQFVAYLSSMKGKVSFIIITETWLKSSTDILQHK